MHANPSYLVQAYAHLYFICGGICFSIKWAFRRILGLRICSNTERELLVKGICGYLRLLKKSGIIELQLEGFEDVDAWKGCIIAPNHPSILDAIILMAFVPSLDCVVNAKLLHNPITSGVVKLCNFIRNDSPLNITKACKDRISKGSNILLFPEGTRTIKKPLNPFHPIYALISKATGGPIRTIFIRCDSEYFGRNFSYFKPAICPLRFRISAGRIFTPNPSTNPRILSSEVEAYFRSELEVNLTHSELC